MFSFWSNRIWSLSLPTHQFKQDSLTANENCYHVEAVQRPTWNEWLVSVWLLGALHIKEITLYSQNPTNNFIIEARSERAWRATLSWEVGLSWSGMRFRVVSIMCFLFQRTGKLKWDKLSLLQIVRFSFILVIPVWIRSHFTNLICTTLNLVKYKQDENLNCYYCSSISEWLWDHGLGFCLVTPVLFLEDVSAIKHHWQHHFMWFPKHRKLNKKLVQHSQSFQSTRGSKWVFAPCRHVQRHSESFPQVLCVCL